MIAPARSKRNSEAILYSQAFGVKLFFVLQAIV